MINWPKIPFSLFFFPCRDAPGIYQLASLLVELDASDEASGILCADALYQMGCVEAAHKLLSLALSRTPQSSPILARLALLQLKKGFIYDGNQVRSTWLAERMRGEEQPKAEAQLSVCSLLSVVANDLCLKL